MSEEEWRLLVKVAQQRFLQAAERCSRFAGTMSTAILRSLGTGRCAALVLALAHVHVPVVPADGEIGDVHSLKEAYEIVGVHPEDFTEHLFTANLAA